jgi:hypothetical protein
MLYPHLPVPLHWLEQHCEADVQPTLVAAHVGVGVVTFGVGVILGQTPFKQTPPEHGVPLAVTLEGHVVEFPMQRSAGSHWKSVAERQIVPAARKVLVN